MALSAVATGIDSFSATAINSSRAPEAVTPPPATITGLLAPFRSFTASAIVAGSATGRNGGTRVNCRSTITSASSWPSAITSPLICSRSRWVGPGVPLTALRNAWRRYAGSISAACTQALYLVTAANGLNVIDLLVRVALLVELALAAGQRYDRRAGQVRVLQTGGQVGGPTDWAITREGPRRTRA